MSLKIVKKINPNQISRQPMKQVKEVKKAVVTILGTVGGVCDKNDSAKGIYNPKEEASYKSTIKEIKDTEAVNTLPILIHTYQNTHEIIAIYTTCARDIQKEVLKNKGLYYSFDDSYIIKDDKNFEEFFRLIDDTINKFDEVIVDVSHGFRHLPILMIVDLIIQNFKDTKKLKHILFAKEIIQHKEYEIIDLKEYLDIANIAFVLSTFEKNYTVASHIYSYKYSKLIDALNNFSNDMMALSLNNLFDRSSKELILELEKIDDVSIKFQARKLEDSIKEITTKKDKRFETYFALAKDLFEKNYMLLSLSLLYESIRLYVKTTIKKQYPDVVENIEKALEYNLYAIGDFFIKFKSDKYHFNKLKKDWNSNRRTSNKKLPLDEHKFNIIHKAFPSNLNKLIKTIADTRNNLAHGNADNKSFQDIKKEIKELLNKYESFRIYPYSKG